MADSVMAFPVVFKTLFIFQKLTHTSYPSNNSKVLLHDAWMLTGV